MLVSMNEQVNSGLTMVIVRPSIVVAAESEPVPGWTDTLGIFSGLTLAAGMGVLKDIPGSPNAFVDLIPVDFVARQLLVAVPFARSQHTHGKNRGLLILQSSSSASNPVTMGRIAEDMVRYQNNFPYEKRAGPAQITFHTDQKQYKRVFKYRSQLPAEGLYYLTRVFGTKSFADKIVELRDGVRQVKEGNKVFKFYMDNEWVFDSANCSKLEQFLGSSSGLQE